MPPQRHPRSNVRTTPYVKQEANSESVTRAAGTDTSSPSEASGAHAATSPPRETGLQESVASGAQAATTPPRETGLQESVTSGAQAATSSPSAASGAQAVTSSPSAASGAQAATSPPRETGLQESVASETEAGASLRETALEDSDKGKQEARHVRRNFRFFYGGLMGLSYAESDSE